MKLWKILLATMIALVLVCAVAMAEDKTEEVCPHIPSDWVVKSYPTCTEGSVDVKYYCTREGCEWSKIVWQTRVNDNALGHNWTVTTTADTKAATCTEEGCKVVKCLRCEEVEKRVIEKLDHAKKLVPGLCIAPTCQKEGVNYYQCDYGCNTEWTETVKKIPCNMQYVEGKAPNCKEDGYTEHMKCSMCKATIGYTVLPKTAAHTSANKVEANSVAATCYTDGVDYFYCSTCGAEYTKVVKATGEHNVTKKAAKAPTCTEDGYTEYWACTTKGCTYTSGKVIVPASGTAHDWAAYGGKKAATCTEGGWEKTEKCKACGAVNYIGKTEKLGHDFAIMVNNDPSTCTKKGYEIKQCVRCTETKTYDLAVLPHNYVEAGWVVRLQPNCESDGQAYRVCTWCGGAEQTKVVPALGHKMATKPAVVIAPTCTKAGEGWYQCERCSLRETTVIKATNHPNKKDIVVAEATCTLPGMKHVWCPDCEKYIESNIIIPATEHKGAKITVTKAATCTAEGERVVECPACGKKTEKIAKLAHKYEWVTITPASPAGNGRDEYKCACGDVKEVKTVKYTKWYYNNTITSFGPTTRELVGGNDWYRVTPVDLTVDGVYTYDLIASNKYVVGKVTITVNAGALTVSYKTNYDVDVKDEALLIYASKADLATGTAVTAPVGAAINAAETFGADSKVLVSLILTGDYDAAGKGLVDASAAAGMIANID